MHYKKTEHGRWLTNQGKWNIGYRRIFIVRYNANETINRHKAKLVTQGYTQTYGIDYKKLLW